mmetsp:Transcript_20083/g.33473  ORF Transcript_20083/g.33473 Transcript_20083/m.33473 type:complete len:559 (+) Transcript_20083:96-1772(+)
MYLDNGGEEVGNISPAPIPPEQDEKNIREEAKRKRRNERNKEQREKQRIRTMQVLNKLSQQPDQTYCSQVLQSFQPTVNQQKLLNRFRVGDNYPLCQQLLTQPGMAGAEALQMQRKALNKVLDLLTPDIKLVAEKGAQDPQGLIRWTERMAANCNAYLGKVAGSSTLPTSSLELSKPAETPVPIPVPPPAAPSPPEPPTPTPPPLAPSVSGSGLLDDMEDDSLDLVEVAVSDMGSDEDAYESSLSIPPQIQEKQDTIPSLPIPPTVTADSQETLWNVWPMNKAFRLAEVQRMCDLVDRNCEEARRLVWREVYEVLGLDPARIPEPPQSFLSAVQKCINGGADPEAEVIDPLYIAFRRILPRNPLIQIPGGDPVNFPCPPLVPRPYYRPANAPRTIRRRQPSSSLLSSSDPTAAPLSSTSPPPQLPESAHEADMHSDTREQLSGTTSPSRPVLHPLDAPSAFHQPNSTISNHNNHRAESITSTSSPPISRSPSPLPAILAAKNDPLAVKEPEAYIAIDPMDIFYKKQLKTASVQGNDTSYVPVVDPMDIYYSKKQQAPQ